MNKFRFLMGVVMLSLAIAWVQPASAKSKLLCSGKDDCRDKYKSYANSAENEWVKLFKKLKLSKALKGNGGISDGTNGGTTTPPAPAPSPPTPSPSPDQLTSTPSPTVSPFPPPPPTGYDDDSSGDSDYDIDYN